MDWQVSYQFKIGIENMKTLLAHESAFLLVTNEEMFPKISGCVERNTAMRANVSRNVVDNFFRGA